MTAPGRPAWLDQLHPDVRRLVDTWDPTDIQQASVAPILAGRHALLVAPTGHGKTEAAMLPVLSRLAAERDRLLRLDKPWPSGFKVLYVTPLRALNRDLLGRLQAWADALQFTIDTRHGDTPQARRTRQAHKPPDILITTPETLQLLLFGDTLRRHLGTVRFVVLDEVHDLAQSERGAQLAAALERLEEVVAQPDALRAARAPERPGPERPSARPAGGFTRIGLSATVADPAQVGQWIVGPGRVVDVVQAGAAKRLELAVEVARPTPQDQETAARLGIPPEGAAQLRFVRDLVQRHGKVLVFCNSRDAAELLVSRSTLLDDGAALLELHHGSLSHEHRADVERRFKEGDLRGVVATSSLELGIDVGAITHVLQVESPRSVARLVQRVGRAGHTSGAVSHATLLATGPEDALECMAVAARAAEGRLEPVAIRPAPLVVLANQIIALAVEYAGLQRSWTRDVLTRAAPFAELDDDLFDAVWDALVDVRTLRQEQGAIQRGGRARRQFLDHVSMIPDERVYRVLDEASKRSVGTVDDAFVAAALQPGALFVMAGRSWRVLEVDTERAVVRAAPSRDLAAVAQWSGSALPVGFEVAQEAAALRARLMDERAHALASPEAVEVALGPVERQVEAGLRVPTDRVLCIEPGPRRTTLHVALGTRGNETLGRILQALLHQRLGFAVGLENDAYRIHLQAPPRALPDTVHETLLRLEPDGLDVLLMLVLRSSPALRHHAVHVAKHFGALPKDLDPNRMAQARLDSLLAHEALQEEALGRLIADRFDVPAVEHLVRVLPELEWVVQGVGPLATLGQETTRGLVMTPRDDTLLKVVRERIEQSDAMLLCTNCRHSWQSQVHLLPRQIRCRRCQSNQVACLRPWNEEARPTLAQGQSLQRDRLMRNAAIVASFGATACRALVARGVGPDTATRILQRSADPEDAAFWRAVLEAELEFARTSAYWGR